MRSWRAPALLIPLALIAAPLMADSNLPPAPLANTALPNPAQERQAKALMTKIRCLVCQGESIAESNSDLAGDMRSMIRERIQAGESPDSIRHWLIRRYGNWVTYDPPFSAQTAGLWLVPLMLVIAGGLLVRGRIKRRHD
ncbi:MAG: cytochrome c-type biogenesis protein CcmH [Alphaproteobacteria bacterium]|nr:cytochrome c-type biogenesis protein CcmH [Alphaproteobacteria bacterium]MDE2341671.1 cytochrome c-type biogenesis protein CcmH [Alphaproteobacteria bacterium]